MYESEGSRHVMRVLVVDDSEVAIAMMSSALAAVGHEVYSSASPIGTSNIILRKQIDVVVIDVELSSFRGERLVELLRKHPRFDRLPIVLVSAQHRAAVEVLAAASGADAAASKMELHLLPHAVEKALAAR